MTIRRDLWERNFEFFILRSNMRNLRYVAALRPRTHTADPISLDLLVSFKLFLSKVIGMLVFHARLYTLRVKKKDKS